MLPLAKTAIHPYNPHMAFLVKETQRSPGGLVVSGSGLPSYSSLLGWRCMVLGYTRYAPRGEGGHDQEPTPWSGRLRALDQTRGMCSRLLGVFCRANGDTARCSSLGPFIQEESGMSYALEKLGLAIGEMAVGEGDVKSRLRVAYKHMSAISEQDFPEHLQKDWRSIMDRLTGREPECDEGRFKATMHRMHKKSASRIAADVVDLHSRLEGFIEDGYEDS